MLNLEHFNQWMHDHYYVDKNSIYNHYIDYNDQIPQHTLLSALRSKYFRDAIWDEIAFNDWYENPFPEIVREYAHENDLNERDIDELNDYCLANYSTNVDIDQLLRNTPMPEVTIVFGDNWDDDYNALTHFEQIDVFDETNEEDDSTLALLVKQQGYKLIDLKNPTTDFLKQVRSECFDYLTELDGQQLVASVKTEDFDLLHDLIHGKPVTLKPGTTFGLFNQIHGSSAGFEIKLEKPLTLNVEGSLPIDDIQVGTRESYMDYTPYGVCGELNHQNREDLETVK